MGVTTNILIADRRLGDDQLATLSLTPRGEQIPAEAVMLTPSDQRVCVARTETSTIIVDGGDALATAVDEELVSLPGTIHFASVASTVSFCDLLVMTDGGVVRHLQQSEGVTTIDEGSALPMEPDFVFPTDDGEGEPEIDGDVLIELLPLIAGLPADVDVFEVVGEGFDSMSDDSGGVERPAQGSAAETEGKKRGFFSRLFGG